MIRLKRSRRADDVPSGLQGAKRREKEMILLRHAAAGGSFDDDFWKSIRPYWKPAREQLFDEAEWKCAYCESVKEEGQEGDVEHFRPKSLYWWLACCYDNYLFACQICNRTWKGNSFPIDGTPMTGPCVLPGMEEKGLKTLVATHTPDPLGRRDGMTMTAFRAACKAERPLLPDPYLVDPEPFLKWVANPAPGRGDGIPRWHVEAAPRNDRSHTTRVFEAVRDCYGLNRERLKKRRGQIYAHLVGLRQIYNDMTKRKRNPGILKVVVGDMRRMTLPESPYAGMVRYFVHDEWKLIERE